MGAFTWRTFALFVAAPALVLAVLGLRAVRAERLDGERRLRDQQTNTTRLVEAAIGRTLQDLARDLPRNTTPPVGIPVVFETSGLVVFPVDRVYFGRFAQHPGERMTAAGWPPALSALIEQAQAAEAQGRPDEALDLLRQIRRADSRLSAWSELAAARIEVRRGMAMAISLLADVRWSESAGTTPSGLPVALVASALSAEHAGDRRRAFAPLIERTLSRLREGRWWLSADERRFYEGELAVLLAEANGGAAGAAVTTSTRLAELEGVEQLIRHSPPSRRDDPSYGVERGGRGTFLMVWSSYDPAAGVWRGLAVPQTQVPALIEPAVTPLVAGMPFDAVLRETGGAPIAGSTLANAWRVEPLQAIRGWEIAFTGPSDDPAIARREWLWYGFIGVLLVVLFGGLAMTAHNLRQKTELARMQSEFVGAVTHEFKSPITSIRLLLERIGAGRLTSPDAAAAYAAAIGREADRLERLVNRLLQAQQIDAGHQRHDFAPASLGEVTVDVVRQVQQLADARSIGITVDLDDGVPSVVIDRAAIADAVENLIDNAIKYSPAGTGIRVHVYATDVHVCVDVEDQGIGIDADEIPRVFDKFYRARRGNLQNVRGTGLGLALVKAAADAHGGSVAVASEPGKGSRFSIRLPLSAQAASAS